MVGKVTTFLLVVFLGLILFLGGYLVAQRTTFRDENQLALVNNSLVSRFNKTEEKYIKSYGITKLSNDEAVAPILSPSGKEIFYYVPGTGQIRSASISNIENQNAAGSSLIAQIKPGLTNIAWSPKGKEMIAFDSAGPSYYNLALGISKKLDRRIKDPVFSGAGDKIAYLFFDSASGEGSISIADPAIDNFKNILKTRSENWSIDWIDDKTLSLIHNQSSFFTLDVQSGNLQKILDDLESLEVLWAANGQRLIYSTASSGAAGAKLVLLEIGGLQEMVLNLETTASKCVWGAGGENIYCALKNAFVTIAAAGPAPDYQTIISDPSASQAENLLLDKSYDHLIFRNVQSGKLYGFSLNP